MATQQQQAPAWSGIVRRSIDIDVKAVDEDAGTFDFIASTDSIDGHGDIVEQSFDLKRYKKNPVVLWQHNAFGMFDGARAEDFLPVGKAENVRVTDGKLSARIHIVKGDGPDSLAEKLRRRLQQGVLRAVSIGFRPGKVTQEENLKNGKTTLRLADNELFEISIVAIPSNPDAVAKSIAFEHEELSRIAAKTAALSGEKEAHMAMSEDEKKAFDAAIVAKGVAESKHGEAALKITQLEKDLTAEKALSSKAQSDLAASTARAEKAEAAVIDSEIDKLVGKKIAPAERDEHIALAKQIGLDRVKSLVEKRPDMTLLSPVSVDGKPVAETKAAPAPVGDAPTSASDDFFKALNARIAKAS